MSAQTRAAFVSLLGIVLAAALLGASATSPPSSASSAKASPAGSATPGPVQRGGGPWTVQGPGGSQPPGPSVAPTISPAPAALVHHQVGRLGFDFPATWTVRPSDVHMRYSTMVEFIGTAPSTAWCKAIVDGISCGVDLALRPGTVSVLIEDVGGPPMPDPFARAQHSPPGTVVNIDGVPAPLTRESEPVDATAALALELFVPAPDRTMGGARIRAEVRGPGEEELWHQVEDLIASVHYEPAIRPTSWMDEAAGAAAARRAIDQLADGDRAYRCFPRVPGRSRHAIVRWLPFYSRLPRRLPVTCSTEIVGTPLELWRMTLTSSWSDAPGRSAGSLRTIVWVGLDGEPESISGGGASPPYHP